MPRRDQTAQWGPNNQVGKHKPTDKWWGEAYVCLAWQYLCLGVLCARAIHSSVSMAVPMFVWLGSTYVSGCWFSCDTFVSLAVPMFVWFGSTTRFDQFQFSISTTHVGQFELSVSTTHFGQFQLSVSTIHFTSYRMLFHRYITYPYGWTVNFH